MRTKGNKSLNQTARGFAKRTRATLGNVPQRKEGGPKPLDVEGEGYSRERGTDFSSHSV